MGNHVHLVAVPLDKRALARTISLAHGRHARLVNAARGWTGHLWANRFYSTALGEAHLWTAIRYVELNPVRAGLVRRAERWPWSSARAHALGAADPLLDPARPFAAGVRDPRSGRFMAWADCLARGLKEEEIRRCARRRAPAGRAATERLSNDWRMILTGCLPRKNAARNPAPPKRLKFRGYSNEKGSLFGRLSRMALS